MGDNARLCRPAESRCAARRPVPIKGLPTRTCSMERTPRVLLVQAWLRDRDTHHFCSSQQDILTCCLGVSDNALAPGRYEVHTSRLMLLPSSDSTSSLIFSGFVCGAAGFLFPSLLFFAAHRFLFFLTLMFIPQVHSFLFPIYVLLPVTHPPTSAARRGFFSPIPHILTPF